MRLERDGDAVDKFETLTTADPAAPAAEKAWQQAGDVYFRAGHYEEAKRSYEGLLGNFTGSSVAAMGLLRIAQCDYNAGRDTDAIEGFSRVTDRFPTHALAEEARRGIEQALYRLGHSADGEAALAELVAKFPGSAFAADAQFEIAVRQYDAQDYASAAEAFRRMVTQFPGASSSVRAQYLMGDSYSRAGDEKSANNAYEQFLVFFPESEYRSEVRLRLGVAKFSAGEYMPAAIDFTTIVSDSSASEVRSAALYNLALCRRLLDDETGAQQALEEFESLYSGNERSGDVAFQLAEIHNKAERTQEATDAYLRALEAGLDPLVNVEAYYRLGEAREKLGDIHGAMRAYRGTLKAIDRSDPFRLAAVARMVAVHEDDKDYANAIKAYRDLIKYSKDEDVVVAATERLSQLQAGGTQR
jgi:TolA-binding protein